MFKSGANRICVAAAVVMAAMTASCGDDKNNPDGPETPDEPSGEMEVMSPTRSKEFLEATAREFLNKFNPADQQDFIRLAAYFEDQYGDLELPESFEDAFYSPASFIKGLSRGIAAGNPSMAASAVAGYTYTIKFDDYKGVYTPGVHSWEKTDESDRIIFKFTDAQGAAAELHVAASADVDEVTLTIPEWEYDYDSYDEYKVDYTYNIFMPHQMNITLTDNGRTMAAAKTTTSIDTKGHKVSAVVEARVCNLELSASAKADDNRVTQAASFKVGGDVVVNNTAEANGKNLCDISAWEKFGDIVDNGNDEAAADYLTGMLKDGAAKVNVLGKVQLTANAKLDRQLIEALDSDFDNYEYSSQDDALKACKRACGVVNDRLNAYFCYNNTTTRQGLLVSQPKLYDEGYGYWWFEVEPVIKFESDGTTYSFSDFFGTGFGGVESLFESLIDNYKRVWESAVR